MINSAVLVGRLTRDPELRYTPNGIAVTNFTLAVNRTFTNKNGEYEADFISCICWNKTAENVASYLKKGSLVGVDGRIQTRSYENNEGRRVFVTEVIAESVQFLEPKNKSESRASNAGVSTNQNAAPSSSFSSYYDPFANDGEPIDITDDDLPF